MVLKRARSANDNESILRADEQMVCQNAPCAVVTELERSKLLNIHRNRGE
jgi:hypothetical protein